MANKKVIPSEIMKSINSLVESYGNIPEVKYGKVVTHKIRVKGYKLLKNGLTELNGLDIDRNTEYVYDAVKGRNLRQELMAKYLDGGAVAIVDYIDQLHRDAKVYNEYLLELNKKAGNQESL